MNRIVRYVVKTFDDRDLDAAFPEGPLPMALPPPAPGPTGQAEGSPQDPNQALSASAQPSL
jgi:hypothetical protein